MYQWRNAANVYINICIAGREASSVNHCLWIWISLGVPYFWPSSTTKLNSYLSYFMFNFDGFFFFSFIDEFNISLFFFLFYLQNSWRWWPRSKCTRWTLFFFNPATVGVPLQGPRSCSCRHVTVIVPGTLRAKFDVCCRVLCCTKT